MKGWTEIEKVGWAAIGASNENPGALAFVPCEILVGLPPANHQPALGDLYITKSGEIAAYTGASWPTGSKFPVSAPAREQMKKGDQATAGSSEG